MAKIAIKDWNNKSVGEVELAPSVFGLEVKKGIIYDVIKWQLASKRQGTAMVKTRSLVSGGGKKPFKQKGTGNARQGSTRSPLMPGGAKLFGPVPRSYGYSLPKKVRQLGLKMALSLLASRGKVCVVSDMASKTGKTKDLSSGLKKLGLEKSFMVDLKRDALFTRASQNLSSHKFSDVDGINVFDLLKYDSLILTPESLSALVGRYQ
jgi:large subunit ribosomal protein L4